MVYFNASNLMHCRPISRLKTRPLWFACFCFSLPALATAQEEVVYESARVVAVNNTVVSSEAPGVVREITVKPGRVVELGEPLVQLNRELFEAELEIAVAEEEIARIEATNRVNLQYASKTAAVTEKTLAKSLVANQQYAKTVSATEVERLNLQLEQALLSGEQAQLEFDKAQWNSRLKERSRHAASIKLASRIVNAPFSGTVAQVYVQPGQWINAGSPVARVIDLEHLRVEGYFAADLIRRVSVGTEARFEYSLNESTHAVRGTVTFVSPEIVEGIFQVWVDIPSDNGLHVPGVEGRLTLRLAE